MFKKKKKDFFPEIKGFVDIKGYKNGKLVYHDCGDNVVTEWMRHAIILLLAGAPYAKPASTYTVKDLMKNTTTATDNRKYYALADGQQFSFAGYDGTGTKLDKELGRLCSQLYTDETTASGSVFPTKILLGTGDQTEFGSYTDFTNSTNYEGTKWRTDVYTSADVFGNDLISADTNKVSSYATGKIRKIPESDTASTVLKMKTVEAFSSDIASPSSLEMYENFSIYGPVKIPAGINPNTATAGATNAYVESSIDATSGSLLLQPKYRGIGAPAFIYFTGETARYSDGKISNGQYVKVAAEPKDDGTYHDHFTLVKFTYHIPAQESPTTYYPYNGYTLKQIGLYNDIKMTNDEATASSMRAKAMEDSGMLLATKFITPITKNYDTEYKLTWTLSI